MEFNDHDGPHFGPSRIFPNNKFWYSAPVCLFPIQIQEAVHPALNPTVYSNGPFGYKYLSPTKILINPDAWGILANSMFQLTPGWL